MNRIGLCRSHDGRHFRGLAGTETQLCVQQMKGVRVDV